MLIQVTNTTDPINYNFKCIFIAKIANVLYEATRDARWVEVKSVVWGFLLAFTSAVVTYFNITTREYWYIAK